MPFCILNSVPYLRFFFFHLLFSLFLLVFIFICVSRRKECIGDTRGVEEEKGTTRHKYYADFYVGHI